MPRRALSPGPKPVPMVALSVEPPPGRRSQLSLCRGVEPKTKFPKPTPTACPAPRALTARISLSPDPLGVLTTVQFDPSQCSARDCGVPPKAPVISPTAQTSFEENAETAKNSLSNVVGLIVICWVQAVPFQRSTRVDAMLPAR